MAAAATLSLAFGAGIPAPAPRALLEQIEEVSVRHAAAGKSGFQIKLRSVRDRANGLDDHLVFARRWLDIGDRVWIAVELGGAQEVLMDGIVTQRQLGQSDVPGVWTITITGEDLSVLMGLNEVRFPFPAPDTALVALLLAPWAALGIVPAITPPLTDIAWEPTESPPQIDGTALSLLQERAAANGYVFYVEAGPGLGENIAWFGPQLRVGSPQRALTVDMGPASNVSSLSFTQDGNKATWVGGFSFDSTFLGYPIPIPVVGFPEATQPLAARPQILNQGVLVRTKLLPPKDVDVGLPYAFLRATVESTASGAAAITASGELDVARYGGVLRARRLVSLRGAGTDLDGDWFVASVDHTIRRGEYRERFTLEREGLGNLRNQVSA